MQFMWENPRKYRMPVVDNNDYIINMASTVVRKKTEASTFLTPLDIFPLDANIAVPAVRRLHVEEAEDVEPLVNDGDHVEAAETRVGRSQVHSVDATVVPPAYASVTPIAATLGYNVLLYLHQFLLDECYIIILLSF